jgi:hypothetical protein
MFSRIAAWGYRVYDREAAELLEAVLDQPSVLEQPGRGRFHHPSRCLHGPNSVYRLV